jgi:hypothetical protein
MEINAVHTMTRFFVTRINHRLLELVGEKWFKNEQERNIRNIFVMTLNGENEDTMLESYEDLSSHVNCDEDVISEIMTSDLPTEEKILSLKDEVKSKVPNWTTWLLIVTNVRDLKKTTRFLPEIGEEEWRNGQILIATTDAGPAIPHGKYKTISVAAEN